MSTLNQTVDQLIAVAQQRDAAKTRWLELLRGEGEGDPMEARRAHLDLDEQFEQKIKEITESLREAQASGLTEFELMTLGREKTELLSQLLAERGFAELLASGKPESLTELVTNWRAAAATLDAARFLNQLRSRCENVADLPALFESSKAEARNEEAYVRAVGTLQAFLANVAASDDQEDRAAEAIHANIRFWLKRYDDLTGVMRDTLEPLVERGSLRDELEEMDTDTRRAVIAAVDGGLIPERQTQTETKTQTRQ
jgi:hypothetical protein